jgi:hypothetical protein
VNLPKKPKEACHHGTNHDLQRPEAKFGAFVSAFISIEKQHNSGLTGLSSALKAFLTRVESRTETIPPLSVQIRVKYLLDDRRMGGEIPNHLKDCVFLKTGMKSTFPKTLQILSFTSSWRTPTPPS